jgi:hypothetical protein
MVEKRGASGSGLLGAVVMGCFFAKKKEANAFFAN